ncbi:MAG: DUF4279 domain-containing protein [Bryobacterales bacterium]|nr:DUF4279 domain-containing protein [Bryobacterales bacterium]
MSTKRPIPREPPADGPEGTVWYGGPVDQWKVTLRVFGDDLDPDHISTLLGCQPSSARKKGDPYPRTGRWLLSIDSKDCGENADVEDGIKMLLERLPPNGSTWSSLTSQYRVDVSCGLFLASSNRGFGLSSELSGLLSERNLDVGFDLYATSATQPPY